ncbi:MAG TPA: 50S ribosomal protein L35 [Nevskiaceae bacterium]
MPKLKTNRGAAKRFTARANDYKRAHSHKRHILTKKAPGRIRKLRGTTSVHKSDVRELKQLLPKG